MADSLNGNSRFQPCPEGHHNDRYNNGDRHRYDTKCKAAAYTEETLSKADSLVLMH